jgi:hypothetical protein
MPNLMNLSNQQLRALLSQLDACQDALSWLGHQRDLKTAWAECPRADWLLWLVGHMAGQEGWPTRAQVVLAACECVEPALRRIPAGEERPRRAIEAARAWASGKIGEDVVEAAMDDAWVASRWTLLSQSPESSAARAARRAIRAVFIPSEAARAAWYAARAVFIPSEAARAAWYAASVAQSPLEAISAMAEVVRRTVQLSLGGEATMKTLVDILTGGLAYDNSWAIYAERIDGEFKPESPARIGQRRFKNGGLLDGCRFFVTNESAVNFFDAYFEGRDPVDGVSEADLKEAALELIGHINEQAVD